MSKVFCFEGVDGVGKSTAMREVSTALTKMGVEHVLTKEPGGPRALMEEWGCHSDDYPFGFPYKSFRDMCVNQPDIPHDVKRALFKADSIYNWAKVGKPATENGIVVLSDRSWVSDLSYGVALTKYSLDQLYQFNAALCADQFEATRVVLLEVNPAIREARLSTNITNEMDKLGADKRDEIAAAYETVVNTYLPAKRVTRVNTAIPLAAIVSEILTFINFQLR